ncbi:MAG: radical SAM protein [Methylocystis silviterrae]|uniref:radical SAM protein n=1 Tax=Methylocystis silviterrae TaxID=2743612 RepID=UPI003C776E44
MSQETLPNAAESPSSSLLFIMKGTKYCNLRCSYCYEFAHLDDPRRMSLDELARFFEDAASYARRHGVGEVKFTWHGGEPFVIPLSVYERIKELQRAAFAGIEVVNGVQTNLTILTDRHVEYLKSGAFFDTVSTSFDVYGDQRVDRRGRPTTDIVLDNMQWLADAGVTFATICVLSRGTAARIVDIYRFFEEAGVNCRILPFHRAMDGAGDHGLALPQAEIVARLCDVFNAWRDAGEPVIVRPLADLTNIAERFIFGDERRVYDKAVDEWAYVVNPNGDLWGISEIEDNRFHYGNVFTGSLEEALASKVRADGVAASRRNIEILCAGCPYHGYCTGYPMADPTEGFFETARREGCHARGVLDHIVARLEADGTADAIRAEAAATV